MPDLPSYEVASVALMTIGGTKPLGISEGQRVEISYEFEAYRLHRVVSLRRSGQQLIITLESTDSTLSPNSPYQKTDSPAKDG